MSVEALNETEVGAKLVAWRAGDTAARDWLVTSLHGDLKQISAALLRAERNSSLSTGDLVNEAVIRLMRVNKLEITDRSHLLCLAAQAMRRILIDHARRKGAGKRKHARVTLLTGDGAHSGRLDFDALDSALLRLGAIDPAKAEIVEMRYFGGMTVEDISEVTGVSSPTVKRHWRTARAWLLNAMQQARNERQLAV